MSETKLYELWVAKTVEDINTANYERFDKLTLEEALKKAKEYLLKGYIEARIHPF